MDLLRPPGRRSTSGREYQRAYKACLSCRQKKARCDLGGGSGGIPPGPPCARCRREQRQCLFSEKRAWERTKRGQGQSRSDASSSSQRDNLSSPLQVQDAAHLPSQSSHTSPSGSHHDRDRGPPSTASGLTSSMMRTVVSSGNDALNLLFEAAAQNGPLEQRDPARNTYNDKDGYHPDYRSARSVQTPGPGPGPGQSSVGTSPAAPAAVDISNPSRDVLDVWESCRFVKMGWFTAKEAITYVDL